MPISTFTDLVNPPAEIQNLDCRTSTLTTTGAPYVEMATIMPFRVKFKTIDIGSYSPTNPPPIGIAIIGFNNYIL